MSVHRLLLFEKIRESCRTVASRSNHVKIHRAGIRDYALSLPVARAVSPELDAHTHFLGNEEDTAAFFLTLDSINFGSGYFPEMKKRPGMSGYFTISSSLTDLFRKKGRLSADDLSRLTTPDCIDIFNQDPGNETIQELMGLFARALNDLGRYLLRHFNGSFLQLIKTANHSAETLAEILTGMPFFRDTAPYGKEIVHFYKRAQLTAADLSQAFRGRGTGYFHDLDRLTIFADNLVPHVLRVDGLLLYDEGLASRIDRGERIPSHSEEEVEIRACAVHAAELIKHELQRKAHDVTSADLDFLLWNRGQQEYYKTIKPRHRTRTVFY